MLKNIVNHFGSVCMNVALATSSISATAAQQAYYRARRGSYSRNTQYIIDTKVLPYSVQSLGKKAKFSETVRHQLGRSHSMRKGQKTVELVLVDANVKNKYSILKQSKPGLDVLEIKRDGDVIKQLTDILSNYKGLDAIHLLSHAQSGKLFIGGECIDKIDLEKRVGAFKAINKAVKKGGDLLLYGCELAKDEGGDEFLEIIKGNTHVDVAASIDKTGNEISGGDWDLEIKKGIVETNPINSLLSTDQLNETLQVVEQEIISELQDFDAPADGSGGATVYTTNGNIAISNMYKTDAGVPFFKLRPNQSIADGGDPTSSISLNLNNYITKFPDEQDASSIYMAGGLAASVITDGSERLTFYLYGYSGDAGLGAGGFHYGIYAGNIYGTDTNMWANTDAFNYLNSSSYTLENGYFVFNVREYGASISNGTSNTWTELRVYELPSLKYTGLLPPDFSSLDSVSVEEGTATTEVILDVNASYNSNGVADTDITYSLSGDDADDFNLDTDDGELRFKVSPDFDTPADNGADNEYNITVTATQTEGDDPSTDQNIKIIVTEAAVVNPIADYADDNNNPVPTISDYSNLGVTGVTSDNLAEINAIVDGLTSSDVDELTEIQALVDAVVAGNVIEDYADSNMNPAPSVDDYEDLGVTGVTVDNLTEVNAAIDELGSSDVDELTEVQDLVDAVVAGNVIEDYADSNMNPAPSVDDYEDLGVTGVTVDNLTEVNAAIDELGSSDVDELTEVQELVDAVIAGNLIEDYADSNMNPAPSVDDYADIGVTGVTVDNLTEVNATIDGLVSGDVDELTEVQDVVDAVVAGNVIEDYADSNMNPAPSVDDYEDLGVTGVTVDNLTEVNAAIDELGSSDVDELTEVQELVDAVVAGNLIEDYADSNMNPAPSVDDYEDLGVTGVTVDNLTEVNAAIDELGSSDVDELIEVQELVDAVVAGNVIEDYADSNTNPAPSVDDYEDLGVTGVTVDNLMEINAAINALGSSDVDELEEVQDIVDEINNPAFTWTGTTSSAWQLASNWDKNAVPDSSANITVPDVANQPVIDSTFGVNHITIEAGATITINSGGGLAIYGDVLGTGQAIVKRNTLSRGYSIIGSPITSQVVSSLTTNITYLWDEVNNTYVSAADSTLSPGEGMFLALAPSVTFSGTLNSDTIEVVLSKVGAGENSISDGNNLVANPYAAAISRSKFISANSDVLTGGAIYFWDDGKANEGGLRDGGYVVVNDLGVTLPARGITGKKFDTLNNTIGSVQGFYVMAENDGDVLKFTPDMQQMLGNADSTFFRRFDNKESLKLSLSGPEDLYQELIVARVDNATNQVDKAYDAPLLEINDGLSFYSLINSKPYAIQAVSKNGIQRVQLGIDVPVLAKYTLEFNSLIRVKNAMLLDRENGITYPVEERGQIELSLEPGRHDNRFELIFSQNGYQITALDASKNLWLSGDRASLIAHTNQHGDQNLTLTDLQGRMIYANGTVKIVDGQISIPSTNLVENTVYILTVGKNSIKFVLP